MRSVVVWADKVHDKGGAKQCIYSIAFKPDGTQLIAAAGNRVLVYETADGELVTSLKGHKDTVYAVAYDKDGSRFASGGADKTVIIWSHELEGMLKYSHNDPIQCLAFNPVSHQLASCSSQDFAFWSVEQKNVNKHKVNSKILCCSWTNDGQYIALGLFNGNVSIRNQLGEEKVLISRPEGQPVWSLMWSPSLTEPTDILAVCDWNQTLSFYMLSGREARRPKKLDYDPCCVNYFSNGEFMVVGGSDKKVSLHTREGVYLHTIGDQEGWVWSAAVRPKQNYVAVGCHDGTIVLYQLIFSTVHGLFKDKYAYRLEMTDVVLQDLSSQKEVRIKCHELVKKIAIYRDRLAVQLPNQINVYDLGVEAGQIAIKLKEKLKKKYDCNLLVVCSNNIILCHERRLQCLSFNGTKEREWVMDATIRYIKVVGGPRGREGLLVGLKNGQILKIFIDNAFPIELIKQQTAVRCLDLSASRRKLAVVDENSVCLVYNLPTKELLFQEPNANSVAWNTQNEDMLCFSGNGMLHIKASDFPVHQQKLQGFVVGFQGSSIYCLHVYAMNAVDVPQSSSMFQYLKKRQFREAYKIACLGVTEADWRALAQDALEGLDIDVAKKSFFRIRELRYLDLIHSIEERKKKDPTADDELYLGDILAYQGRFDEAAALYVKTGQRSKALHMYCDLRMFDKATDYVDNTDPESLKYLMKKQAEWITNTKDTSSAISMLETAGEHRKAVDLMGENKMYQRLIDKARLMDKNETEVLTRIAFWLRKGDQFAHAAEVLQSIKDTKGLIELFVGAERWEEAVSLADKNPDYKTDTYLAYAKWLAENDRYEDAENAYTVAGMPERAIEVLEILTHNAVMESRFNDAAYYFWRLSQGCLQTLAHTDEGDEHAQEELAARFKDYQRRADMYYAYHSIQRYIEEPFTSHLPESLFNIARYLLYCFQQQDIPLGISKVNTLFALAKQSKGLEAFKLARHAYERLQQLKVPDSFREHIDVGAIAIRGKPLADKDELMPLCYRCSTHNPLLNTQGPVCVGCKQPFVFSFHSFEVLPLVEFVLDTDISDDEAAQLISNDTLVTGRKGSDVQGQGGAQVMRLDGGGGSSDTDGDLFQTMLSRYAQSGASSYEPIRVSRDLLQHMPSHEVFVLRGPRQLGSRYFRNVMPELGIAHCKSCNRLFHSDDFELLVLQRGACPFCRTKDYDAAPPTKAIDGGNSASSSA